MNIIEKYQSWLAKMIENKCRKYLLSTPKKPFNISSKFNQMVSYKIAKSMYIRKRNTVVDSYG